MHRPMHDDEEVPMDDTPLATMWVQMHEMFRQAREAGFTEYQACVILGTWLAGLGKGET